MLSKLAGSQQRWRTRLMMKTLIYVATGIVSRETKATNGLQKSLVTSTKQTELVKTVMTLIIIVHMCGIPKLRASAARLVEHIDRPPDSSNLLNVATRHGMVT